MGKYDGRHRRIMEWQSTLGVMKRCGTRVILTGCHCETQPADLDALIAELGAAGSLWDLRPYCGRCAIARHYMASPGPGAPFRPLLSAAVFGPGHEADRQAFLRSLGLSKRDVVRICALAEATSLTYAPAALSDLDAPIRVGACMMGQENRFTGTPFGSWAGRRLLYWRLNEAELKLWRGRRPGPRPL